MAKLDCDHVGMAERKIEHGVVRLIQCIPCGGIKREQKYIMGRWEDRLPLYLPEQNHEIPSHGSLVIN